MGVTREEDHDLASGMDSIMFHGVLSPEVVRDHHQLMSTPLTDDPLDPDASIGTEAPKSEPKHRRRGRPRIHESEEMANDKRKRQIRLAQRAHRSRKEEKMTFLETKVSELEQKMTDIRKLCIGIRAAVDDTGIATAYPSLLQAFHHDLLQLLSITEADPQASEFSSTDLSRVLDGSNKFEVTWDDALFNLNHPTTDSSPLSSDDQMNQILYHSGSDPIYLDNLLAVNGLHIQYDMSPDSQHLAWN